MVGDAAVVDQVQPEAGRNFGNGLVVVVQRLNLDIDDNDRTCMVETLEKYLPS